MPTTKRKIPIPEVKSRRVAAPGADGKTLGQRVREAMAYQSGVRRSEYRQADLVADVRKLSGGDDTLQQAISAIVTDKVTRSALTPFIARACQVDALWLASGVGSMISKD